MTAIESGIPENLNKLLVTAYILHIQDALSRSCRSNTYGGSEARTKEMGRRGIRENEEERGREREGRGGLKE